MLLIRDCPNFSQALREAVPASPQVGHVIFISPVNCTFQGMLQAEPASKPLDFQQDPHGLLSTHALTKMPDGWTGRSGTCPCFVDAESIGLIGPLLLVVMAASGTDSTAEGSEAAGRCADLSGWTVVAKGKKIEGQKPLLSCWGQDSNFVVCTGTLGLPGKWLVVGKISQQACLPPATGDHLQGNIESATFLRSSMQQLTRGDP